MLGRAWDQLLNCVIQLRQPFFKSAFLDVVRTAAAVRNSIPRIKSNRRVKIGDGLIYYLHRHRPCRYNTPFRSSDRSQSPWYRPQSLRPSRRLRNESPKAIASDVDVGCSALDGTDCVKSPSSNEQRQAGTFMVYRFAWDPANCGNNGEIYRGPRFAGRSISRDSILCERSEGYTASLPRRGGRRCCRRFAAFADREDLFQGLLRPWLLTIVPSGLARERKSVASRLDSVAANIGGGSRKSRKYQNAKRLGACGHADVWAMTRNPA